MSCTSLSSSKALPVCLGCEQAPRTATSTTTWPCQYSSSYVSCINALCIRMYPAYLSTHRSIYRPTYLIYVSIDRSIDRSIYIHILYMYDSSCICMYFFCVYVRIWQMTHRGQEKKTIRSRLLYFGLVLVAGCHWQRRTRRFFGHGPSFPCQMQSHHASPARKCDEDKSYQILACSTTCSFITFECRRPLTRWPEPFP